MLKLILSLIFYKIISALSNDFCFYYDNSQERIYFTTENNFNSTNNTFLQTKLLVPDNLEKQYISKAGIYIFDIQYYSCLIPSLSNETLELIKVEYNLTEPRNSMMTEILLNFNNLSGKIFPQKYKDEFIITQSNKISNKARIKRDTLIFDTFGFNIQSKNNLNFNIAKILLVNFRKDKLNYLANLSYNVRKTSNNTFDIYLKNLPEDFDLLVTLDILDKNFTTNEKVLIIRKEFEYPKYKIEDANPNKSMIISAITFIVIAFVLIVIFVLLKMIFGFF